MRESLDSLRKDIADFHADLGVDWCPDSRAAVEFSQAKIPDLVTTNWSSSFFLIELGFEHLSSLIRTMEEPLCPLACGTCVRSMLESCSIASWLLQPNITPHERIGRGYAYRYSGMEQYAKYLRENHPGSSALDQLKGRICEVEREAVSLGYTEVANKEGKRIGIGRRMPSATEVIKLMLAHGGYYRILSAVSHGHNWAIRSLGFALVASPEAPTPDYSWDMLIRASNPMFSCGRCPVSLEPLSIRLNRLKNRTIESAINRIPARGTVTRRQIDSPVRNSHRFAPFHGPDSSSVHYPGAQDTRASLCHNRFQSVAP